MENKTVLLTRVDRMQDPTSVSEYVALGGFSALKKAMATDAEALLDEFDAAVLRGRGGAAYPMGKKWRHLYHSKATPKYIVCNADEGEPGTFKDKLLLSKDRSSLGISEDRGTSISSSCVMSIAMGVGCSISVSIFSRLRRSLIQYPQSSCPASAGFSPHSRQMFCISSESSASPFI